MEVELARCTTVGFIRIISYIIRIPDAAGFPQSGEDKCGGHILRAL